MISAGTMVLLLAVFAVAIGGSFVCGFLLAKSVVKAEPNKDTEVVVPEYTEPKPTFYEKMIDFIEEAGFKRKDRDSGSTEIKTVVTADGKKKNDNDFY